jgi:thiol-disulfide isomerase/thioredoxin
MHSIPAGLLGLLIVCFGSTGIGKETGALPVEAAVTTAPSFELVTFGGAGYSNASLKGKPALLVFWAPWCKVCQHELPGISRFYTEEKPAVLEILSIGFADSRTNVEAFMKERAGSFAIPTAYDEDRWVSQAFKVNATPTYVLLDDQGRIALIHRGGGILHNPQFREFLSRLRR